MSINSDQQFPRSLPSNKKNILLYIIVLAALILETSFSLWLISPERLVVTAPKIATNLPRTYEKLHCKVKPY